MSIKSNVKAIIESGGYEGVNKKTIYKKVKGTKEQADRAIWKLLQEEEIVKVGEGRGGEAVLAIYSTPPRGFDVVAEEEPENKAGLVFDGQGNIIVAPVTMQYLLELATDVDPQLIEWCLLHVNDVEKVMEARSRVNSSLNLVFELEGK